MNEFTVLERFEGHAVKEHELPYHAEEILMINAKNLTHPLTILSLPKAKFRFELKRRGLKHEEVLISTMYDMKILHSLDLAMRSSPRQ